MSINSKSKPANITGRDGYIMLQALAYAIECIEHLPERWQEWSNKEDMKTLLVAYASQYEADFFRMCACAHIEGRGCEIKDGKLNLLPQSDENVVSIHN